MSTWDAKSQSEQLAFWAESERLLLELLDSCAPRLAAAQHDLASELIAHNEHGVAFELIEEWLAEQGALESVEITAKLRAVERHLQQSAGD
jgi:hypothetical protein